MPAQGVQRGLVLKAGRCHFKDGCLRGVLQISFRKEYAILNLKDLSEFKGSDAITPEALLEKGVIRKLKDGVKILGEGDLKGPLTIKANKFSNSAIKKIEAAGGKAEVI